VLFDWAWSAVQRCGSHRWVSNWILEVVPHYRRKYCVSWLEDPTLSLLKLFAVVASNFEVAPGDEPPIHAQHHRQNYQRQEEVVALHLATAPPDSTVASCSAVPLDTVEIACFYNDSSEANFALLLFNTYSMLCSNEILCRQTYQHDGEPIIMANAVSVCRNCNASFAQCCTVARGGKLRREHKDSQRTDS
jgi:hypothetical protein